MKKITFLNFIFAVLIIALQFSAAQAQDEPQDNMPNQRFNRQLRRPNLLERLGLSPTQIQQIRRINQDRKPKMQEAQMHLGEARRKLDQAIYADSVNDAEVQNLLKEFQLAQAEVIKIRTESELAIRKVLTQEQLVKFREIRRQFMERMEGNQNNPPFDRPNRRKNNRGMPPPPVN